MKDKCANHEITKTLRRNWLQSIQYFGDYKLQRETWLDLTNTNPYYSYIECMCIYFDDLNLNDNYESFLRNEIISKSEFEIIKKLHNLLNDYKVPCEPYEHEKILNDPKWIEITKEAKQAYVKLTHEWTRP